jgi:hypothetical protein
MKLTAKELQKGIKIFASKISNQTLGLAYYRPDNDAKHTNCIANVFSVKKKLGGDVRYGWYFSHRQSVKFGHYLIATHHAVWHNPNNLTLVDVTPLHTEEKHRPITQNGNILFLVDDKALPIEKGNMILPLPSRFYPLGSDPIIRNYAIELQNKEYEYYNNQYGIKDVANIF